MDKKARFISAKKKFQEEHRRLGLCYDCNNRPEPGKSRCPSCMEKRRLNEQARRASAISKGLCVRCCRHVKMPSHRLCEDCYFKETSLTRFGTISMWQAIKLRFQEQEGHCALSGYPLVLGENSELDHIVPSSRGGTDSIDNLQWVLCVVNRMKDHLLEAEFFALIEKLYHTMKEAEGTTG